MSWLDDLFSAARKEVDTFSNDVVEVFKFRNPLFFINKGVEEVFSGTPDVARSVASGAKEYPALAVATAGTLALFTPQGRAITGGLLSGTASASVGGVTRVVAAAETGVAGLLKDLSGGEYDAQINSGTIDSGVRRESSPTSSDPESPVASTGARTNTYSKKINPAKISGKKKPAKKVVSKKKPAKKVVSKKKPAKKR